MMNENKLIKFEITIFLIICIVFGFNLICYFTKNSSEIIAEADIGKISAIKEKFKNSSGVPEGTEEPTPKFELTKIDGDTNEGLANSKFIVYAINKDGKREFAKDVDGNYIGTNNSEDAIELELFSTDGWTKDEDNKWISDSSSTLKSNEFEITKPKTLSFEYAVKCYSIEERGLRYSIINTETNEIVDEYTKGANGNAYRDIESEDWDDEKKKYEVDLEPGKYVISFEYYGRQYAVIKNVQIDPYTMFTVTTDELGKIEMELPEGLYEIVEIDAPEKYELPENEEDRTYYFRVGEEKETEDRYTPEWAINNTGMGQYNSEIETIVETSDGNYLAGGNFYGTLNFDGKTIKSKNYRDGLLVKYNVEGEIIWISNVDSLQYITSVIETSDNGYLVLGYNDYGYRGTSIEILKYNVDGEIIWTDSFKNGNRCSGNSVSIIENNKGEYIVTANLDGPKIEFKDNRIEPITVSNNMDAVIVKYDKDGNVIKANSFGGSGYDYIKSIIKTDDGGYIVGGYYSSSEINIDESNKLISEGKYDGFLIRYDQNDQVIWARNIGGENEDCINSITDVVDNEFIVGGYFYSTEIKLKDEYLRNSDKYKNVLLLKYDLDGEVIWSTNLGEDKSEGNSYGIESVSQTEDGGFIIGGNFNDKTPLELNGYTIEPRSNYTNVFLIKYNKENEVEWANSIGGSGYCGLNTVLNAGDSGFITAGTFNARILSIGDYKLKYTTTRYSKKVYENLYVAKLTNASDPKYEEKPKMVIKKFVKEEYRKDIGVSKVWKDNSESRSEKIKLVLSGKVNDEEVIKREVVIPNEETEIIDSNTWKYTFESLPETNVEDNKIIYKIYEEEVNESDLAKYTSKISDINEDNLCEVTNIKNGTYNLELLKQDKDTKVKLSGAEFSVQMGTEPAKTYITNEDGILTIPEVAITGTGTDTIKITETKAPAGYKKVEGTLEIAVNKIETDEGYFADKVETKAELANTTVALNEGKVSVTVENEKITGKYEIELLKQDKDTKAKLSGAEFSVQVGTEPAKTYTTNAEGILAIPEVAITETGTDTIKITETKAPAGYKKVEGTLELEVTKIEQDEKYIANKIETKTGLANTTVALNEGKVSVTVENEKITGKYEIELLKQDKESKAKLSNATFKVQIGTLEEKEYTTDENGIISIPNIEITEAGTDTIKITETKAPAGYKKVDGTLELEVTKVEQDEKYIANKLETKTGLANTTSIIEDGKITVTVENEKITGKYEIELLKQDKDTKAKLIGAEFSVQMGDGEVKTYATNEEGILTIPEVAITGTGTDTIKITETKAPAGYKKVEGTLELEVTKVEQDEKYSANKIETKAELANTSSTIEDGKITVTVENEKITGKYNLELIKQDKDTKAKLSNAEFSIQVGAEPAKTYTTNAEGILAIPEVAITETGTDTIKITETKAPNGYRKVEGTLELEVTKVEEDEKYIANKIETKTELANTTVALNEGKVSVTVENEKITGKYEIELLKQDKDTKAKLSNAEFSVQIGDGEVKTYTTNADGILTIPEVAITGTGTDTIKIIETKAPEGYIKTEGTLELIVNKAEKDEEYFVDSIETKNEIEGTAVSLDGGKISVVVDNEIEEVATYKLQLIKKDKTLDLNLEGADFSVQIGNNEPKIYTTDESGIIELPEIEFAKFGTNKIKIEEINAPYGYLATPGVLEITVTKVKSGDEYIVGKIETKKSTIELDAEVYLEDGVVVAIVRNQKIEAPIPDDPEDTAKGKYEVEIVKVNQFGEVITSSPASFNVNGKIYSTENGIAKVDEVEINKANSKVVDKYFITETQAPEGHTKFDGNLEVEIYKKLSDDETAYKANKAILKATDKDGNEIERGDKVQIVTEDGVTKVIINVVNYEKVDLALRKFISAVSSKEEDYITSREPKVDLEVLDNGESTTAKYNHSEEAIIVRKQDTIMYTLRVYNEGRINAYASQVVDYLPEGLEFVADSEVNKIWNYDEETKKLTTNENYEAKLLLGHEEGKELDCQDLKVECKISDNVAEDTNIVNKAEITEYKYEDGTLAEDRDSHSDNLEDISGQEDDNDFEIIFVKSIKGKYELDIVKTDKIGNTISDLIAKFDINGTEKSTENGIIKFENIEINKTNVGTIDKYTIKETQAPDDYSKFDGTIEVEVSKKLSEDEEYYEVDKVTMKVIDSEGNAQESKDIEVINEDGTTKIVVKVVNYEKVDLALRKFISAVSSKETFKEEDYITSREPKVDLEKLDKGESTTAVYKHSKETVKVEKGDYILYTIRVYNEGKVNAYATKVVDYLPEGLEFVKDAEENKIWDYDEETRKLTTNEKYKPELLNAHEEGKELAYQDLKVICKVKSDVKEDTSIVNIAEITEIKDEDGRTAEDRDSTPDNIEDIPGQEDDDDFEKIIVEHKQEEPKEPEDPKKPEEPKKPEVPKKEEQKPQPEQPKTPDSQQPQQPAPETPKAPAPEQPKQQPAQQQPQQQQPQPVPQTKIEPKVEPKVESKTEPKTYIPATGDILPQTVLTIIAFVVLLNIVQIVISKKKNK